jgi:hypothetical protein
VNISKLNLRSEKFDDDDDNNNNNNNNNNNDTPLDLFRANENELAPDEEYNNKV